MVLRQKNPFNFKHYSLSQLKVYLDGQILTAKPIEPNFDQGQYITGYNSLFSGSGKHFKDEGNAISREDYSILRLI